jgi:hypothetical protein
MLTRFVATALLSTAILAGCTDDVASPAPEPDPQPMQDPIGPGATLKCDSSGKNAYETYGKAGFEAFVKAEFEGVVAELTANQDRNLGGSFGKVGTGVPASAADDFPTFEGKLAAFLVWAYGGPASVDYKGKTYRGPQDMKIAHTGLNITADQYTYFLTKTIVPALLKVGVTEKDVGTCFAPPLQNDAFIKSIVGQ